MKCTLLVAISLLLAIRTGYGWGQRLSYDPSSKQQNRPRQGFVDFAFKQINPQNTDHGCQWDEARKLAVDQTVKSIDSWAVLVALGFLVLSFFLLLHQHRERSRREAIAAQFLAQYHNAWVDARTQTVDVIRRYNQLVHTNNRASKGVLRPPSNEADPAQARPVKADVGRSKTQSPPVAAANHEINASEHGGFRSEATCQNREPDADLIAQISTLQQQLNASHEREKNLQKELSKTQRRGPALQSRDASLPG